MNIKVNFQMILKSRPIDYTAARQPNLQHHKYFIFILLVFIFIFYFNFKNFHIF